jgi:ferredoxin
MAHVITQLCLRDNGCLDVCPVECIKAGEPVEQWPTYYIDPHSCIDCGACVPECPFSAIFPDHSVPAAYTAKGGEWINMAGLTGHYEGRNHYGKPVVLETTRALAPGEMINLRESIQANTNYYQ